MRGEKEFKRKQEAPKLTKEEFDLGMRFRTVFLEAIRGSHAGHEDIETELGCGGSTLDHWRDGYTVPGRGRSQDSKDQLERVISFIRKHGTPDEELFALLREGKVKPNPSAYGSRYSDKQESLDLGIPPKTDRRKIAVKKKKKVAKQPKPKAKKRGREAAAPGDAPGNPMRSSDLVAALQAAEMELGDKIVKFRIKTGGGDVVFTPVRGVVSDAVSEDGSIILE